MKQKKHKQCVHAGYTVSIEEEEEEAVEEVAVDEEERFS